VSTFSDSLVTGGVFWHPMLIINRPQTLTVFNNLFMASFLLDCFWYSENSLRNSHAKVGKNTAAHYQDLQPIRHVGPFAMRATKNPTLFSDRFAIASTNWD